MADENNKKSLFQNWISVIGSILSIVFFTSILTVTILDFWTKQQNPYLGAIAYLTLPVFLALSLLLIPFGAWRERSEREKRGYVRKFPQIDFNNPTHQKWAYTTVGIVTLFVLFSMFGSYHAYEFTESVTFCGKMCHQVMAPEFTAYHNSPHAKVACVHCHIGPGADWFVKSKISGMYQVYSVIAKKYHKPIETPVKNLRPAQETCEQCHWPEKFFGAIEQDHHYFLSDEANTPWQTRMLMHVGGGGKEEGIHWHMNIANQIYYIATDEKRQEIPWVKVTHKNGKEEYFVDTESKFSADKPPPGEMRRMDCIDCHNRPSHIYKAPDRAVNEAMAKGIIDPGLPYMKREAVKALAGKYESHEDAEIKIRDRLENFYKKNYPQIFKSQKTALDKSTESIIQIYQNNFFPEMKVSWEAYPENIGHWIAPGCFRCHDGKHESPEGKVISKDCKSCHTIITQGGLNTMESAVDGLEFKHPDGDQESWKEMSCTDCHAGGPS